jgi:hypothetical protein
MNVSKKLLGSIAAAALITMGCPGGDDTGGSDAGTTTDAGTTDAGTDAGTGATGFPQPANTVPLNFTIDASARPGAYANEDLEWKGQFTYNKDTRVLTFAGDWAGGNGPYVPLYDDGPWSAGGHEPAGAVAGDNKFGITAFLPVQTEALKIDYGAQIKFGTKCTQSGGCWIWKGSNGSVNVPANSTAAVTAAGLKLDPVGSVDVKITLDTDSLAAGTTVPGPVKLKGTLTAWSEDEAFDNGQKGDDVAGDGIFTYVLSQAGNRELVAPGARVEFIWTLGGTPVIEYKNSSGEGEKTGVKAYSKAAGGSFVERTIIITTGEFKNTAIDIPE